MEGHRRDLEGDADEEEHEPDSEADVVGHRPRLGDLGDHGEVDRAGEAVDERAAVEQHAGRKRSQHEILEAGLAGADVVALDGGDDVERQALQLDAEEERDEVAGRDHQHHAESGEQQEHRVLEAQQLGAGEIAERHDENERRAGEHQELHEAGEGIGDERAFKQARALRGSGREQDRGGEHNEDRDHMRGEIAALGAPAERPEHEQHHCAHGEDDLGQHRRILRELLHERS